ncbi:zinc transporter 7-like protein [Zopfochytrium polystomum]|nr:zinc transporter 7-like protein [Zopfochytrium polystomum]
MSRLLSTIRKQETFFFFLLLNITFTFVEFLYGWWTNSLGLTSDAVHMLFDSTALIFSLLASVIAKWEANERFTYGYGRVETLTGFANALALVFASVGIIWEAFERLFDPPKIELDSLLTVSILGLLVNLVGIFAFDHGGMGHDHGGHGHSHGGHSHGVHAPSVVSSPENGHQHGHNHNRDHGHGHGNELGSNYGHDHDDHGHEHDHERHGHLGNHGHDHGSHGPTSPTFSSYEALHGHSTASSFKENPLLHGMFLHVLSDTLGSVGVIISTLLIKYYGWTWADPLVSLFIAVLTLISIWPLLVSSTNTLLQRIPACMDGKTTEAYRKIRQMRGVVGFSNAHFWELSQDKNVGSIKVQVTGQADEEKLRMQINGLFRELGINDMVIQLERDIIQG